MGPNFSDPEILKWVDEKFLVTDSLNLNLLTPKGEFAVDRHRENLHDRGDEDSVARRQQSVEEIGIRQELRSPPWLVQHPKLGVDDRFQALHWGTLFEGAKRAWLKDTQKVNPAVQTTINTPIKAAKLYRRDLTRDAARFLVEYGNLLNEEATATTILQVWRSTTVVEPAWTRHRHSKQWTAAALGQQLLNEKKLEFASVMYPGRWSTYTAYERCNTFWKVSAAASFEVEGISKTVFDDVHFKFKQSIAASQMTGSSFDAIFKLANDCCRALKDHHPEAIGEVIMLGMPKNTNAWGSCSLLPGFVGRVSLSALQ